MKAARKWLKKKPRLLKGMSRRKKMVVKASLMIQLWRCAFKCSTKLALKRPQSPLSKMLLPVPPDIPWTPPLRNVKEKSYLDFTILSVLYNMYKKEQIVSLKILYLFIFCFPRYFCSFLATNSNLFYLFAAVSSSSHLCCALHCGTITLWMCKRTQKSHIYCWVKLNLSPFQSERTT